MNVSPGNHMWWTGWPSTNSVRLSIDTPHVGLILDLTPEQAAEHMRELVSALQLVRVFRRGVR